MKTVIRKHICNVSFVSLGRVLLVA